MTALRFTLADLEAANDAWGCNCGPGALAAICGLTLDEVRPHFGARFPGYANPTAMFAALYLAGRRIDLLRRTSATEQLWPRWGLCRIQWQGPWTQPGVNPRWAYRHTHWVGASRLQPPDGSEGPATVCVWDVNQLGAPLNGDGWAPIAWWTARTVPELTRGIPRATGGWHITHAIEVTRS